MARTGQDGGQDSAKRCFNAPDFPPVPGSTFPPSSLSFSSVYISIRTPETISSPVPCPGPKPLPQTCPVSGCCSSHRIPPWAWMFGNGHGRVGMGMKYLWTVLSSASISRLCSRKPRRQTPQVGSPEQILSQGAEPPHPCRVLGAVGSGCAPWCLSTSASKPKSFTELSVPILQHLPRKPGNRRVNSDSRCRCLRLKYTSLNTSKTHVSKTQLAREGLDMPE